MNVTAPGRTGPTRSGAPTRAIVLGASGFLGRWMARTLTAAGTDLTLVTRTSSLAASDAWAIRGRVVRLDLMDEGGLAALIATERPDVVFNLAGYGVDRNERDAEVAEVLNTRVPQTVASVCADLPATAWNGVRFVHAGSALEYGVTGGILREDSPAQPTTLYGRTKLAGTQGVARVARSTGVRAMTARLFTVFGPGEHAGRLFPSLVEAAATNADIPLSAGLQERDFAFAGDVCESLLHLASAPVRPGEVVNVASGAMHSVRRFALEAARVLGIDESRLRFGEVAVRPEEMSHTGVSVERLIELVGTALTPQLSVAVRRGVNAIRDVGWRPGA